MKSVLCCLVLGSILAVSLSKPTTPSSTRSTSLFCQFFDDGNYNCYPNRRTANDDENASRGQRDSFGTVGVGAVVKGPWKSDDGFFQLPEKGHGNTAKKYIGSCILEKDHMYFECSAAAPPCPTPTKNGPPVGCVGSSVFRGSRWSGVVGGRLRAGQ